MRAAIPVLIGVLLLVFAWFAFGPGDGPAPALEPVVAATAPTGPSPAATAAAASAWPDPMADARQVAAELASTRSPAIPVDATWLEILVVDAGSDLPIADAEAVWSDDTQAQRILALSPRERDFAWRDQEGIAARWGWRGRSDRAGKLRVHVGKSETQVFVRSEGRYGEGSFRAGMEVPEGGHRLVVEAEVRLQVRVIDHDGEPVTGVPVVLENVDPDGRTPRQELFVGDEISDGEGMVSFAPLQRQRQWWRGPRRGEPVAGWRVRSGIPGIDVAAPTVDPREPPAEPLVLRLPPTGGLRVRVTLDGAPLPGLEDLALHAGPRHDMAAMTQAWVGWLDRDGWFRFSQVPLGKTFFVLARRGGSWEYEVHGPTLPGQEVAVSIDLKDEVVVLTGRMFTAAGQPLANGYVSAEFRTNFASGGAGVTTDAAGRFVWPLRQLAKADATDLQLSRLSFVHRPAEAAQELLEVPPRDLGLGRNDLGELHLAAAALVVGGRLSFDSPGSASVGLEVQRQREEPGSAGLATRWEKVPLLQSTVGEDGSFAVHGRTEPGRHRLFFTPGAYLPVEPVEFVLGATDVLVSIRRGHGLSVTCRLPVGVAPRFVHPRLLPVETADGALAAAEGLPGNGLLRGRAAVVGDGTITYQWPALPAGVYTLVVEVPGYLEPFATVPEVVLPLPPNGDPRLADLDLRDRMGTVRLHVEVAEVERAVVFVMPQPQPADRDWAGFALQPGHVVLPAPKRPLQLLVASDGKRPQLVAPAAGEASVRLTAWPIVEVRVAGAEALPPEARLRLRCEPMQAPTPSGRSVATERGMVRLDDLLQFRAEDHEVANGVTALGLGDGVMRLRVLLSLGSGGQSVELTRCTPSEIVVGAPVTVTLSSEEIRSAVAAAPAARDGGK